MKIEIDRDLSFVWTNEDVTDYLEGGAFDETPMPLDEVELAYVFDSLNNDDSACSAVRTALYFYINQILEDRKTEGELI